MGDGIRKIEASRIVVVMPSWLGDGVMATPFLRGLRGLYPHAHIAAVARPLVAPVCLGVDFVDEIRECQKGREGAVSRWMRRQNFELGVLLPNSLRSAWMLWRGGVKRRLGYARDGRGLLLTDRLQPVAESDAHATQGVAIRAAIALIETERAGDDELVNVEVPPSLWKGKVMEVRRTAAGEIVRREIPLPQTGTARINKFEPVPAIDYYLELLRYLRGDGAATAPADKKMVLGVTGEERAEAQHVLAALQVNGEFVVLVPGANFGSSKCWMPERFAAVADQLIEQYGTPVLLATSPAEEPIAQRIWEISRQRERVHVLSRHDRNKGVSLGAIKEIVRRARLMIANDTGPRHFAAAFDVPVVTLFGPTDPRWAETFFPRERIVRVDVPCGPCQLKTCPIDHRCMQRITVERVMAAVRELWT